MASKTLTFLLFGFLLVPSIALASSTYTDQDIINKYHTLNDLTIAMDSGEINSNDLPDDMQTLAEKQAIYGTLTPNNEPIIVQTHETKDSGSGVSIYLYTLPFLSLLLPLFMYLRKHIHIKTKTQTDSSEEEYKEVEWDNNRDGATMPKGFKYKTKVTNPRIQTHHKLLLALGLVKVVKKDA